MARTVKDQEYAEKRNKILASAQRLIFTKGYERMAIQDILADLQISSGAFYHYFDTKPAVLEALIERMQEDAEQPLRPIIQDNDLTAIEKLQRFFTTLDRSRITQKTFIAGLARVWFTDDNAIVREKVDAALIKRRAPLLNAIVLQGIQEGVFNTPYPDQAGEIILSLAHGMGNTLVRLMLSFEQAPDRQHCIDDIAATYAAYAETIERMLGARSHFLSYPDAQEIKGWLSL